MSSFMIALAGRNLIGTCQFISKSSKNPLTIYVNEAVTFQDFESCQKFLDRTFVKCSNNLTASLCKFKMNGKVYPKEDVSIIQISHLQGL